MPYLTPDEAPDNTVCRVLFIPNTLDWIAIVTGALQELTFSYNWEKYGAITPQQAADRAFTMLNEFIDNKAGCRVIGEIVPFAGATNPMPGLWLPCDGQSLLRADYPDLFNVIGIAFGSADATHFNIPDLRRKTMVHQGSGYTIGVAVGEETVTLTWQQMPVHTHVDQYGHLHGYIYPEPIIINGGLEAPASSAFPGFGGMTDYAYVTLENAGNGQPHNNVSPAMPMNMFIVAKDR